MKEILDFFLLFLAQFSGGPGPPENNFVRFGLAATFWGILLYVAWSRQRKADLPREKLLVLGFSLGFLREIFMLSRASLRILYPASFEAACLIMEPIEHALILASMVVISGSFLRYILDDALLARRFLQIGLGLTAVGYVTALFWWPQQLNDLGLRFSESGPAWLMHVMASLILLAAIIILISKKTGWLRNVVTLALFLFFLSECLAIINLSLPANQTTVLCPLSNTLYVWTIPLFGYIYFREQGSEKRQAEKALAAYREHLEELVKSRTIELVEANKKLERTVILEERQRIAAEMHDGLAQTLSYLGMKMDGAAEMLQNGNADQVMDEFDQMQRGIGQAALDVRRSIASLQENPQPRQSLQKELAQLIEEREEVGETAVQITDQLNEPFILPPNELEQVKRLVGEALLNAYRHGQANHITVSMNWVNDDVQIIVADDGKGFDPENQAMMAGDHFGLSIMKARAARVKGDLVIHSQPGQGTAVALTWKPNGRTDHMKLPEVTT